MKIEQKIVPMPTTVSVAQKVDEALKGIPHGSAVLLVPTAENEFKTYYRGTGGAWWFADFGAKHTSVRLDVELRDVVSAVLISCDDVQKIVSGDKWLTDGKDV